jgi:hypothetical protein
MNSWYLGLIMVFTMSCGAEKSEVLSEKQFLSDITSLEDSLMTESMKTDRVAATYEAMQQRYVAKLIEMYRLLPASEKSALSLDKAHMVYSGMGDYVASTKWADTLLMNFPKYKNRAMILESQASSYDALLVPRDSAKVRKYYTQLLNEFPKLDKTKREDIEKRLKFNKLSFDQYIEIQILEDVAAQ